MSSWPGSNPVSLTFLPVGLRDWFLLKRKSGPPGQESLNWGERAVLCNCAKKAPHPCLSVLLLSPEWEWGEAFLLDSGDHLPTPLTRVSCGSLYVGSSDWMIASAVDESWSLLTPGGCSHRRCNFPLQFVAHEAAWETGPKCILGHAIPLPETAEWLPVCGINTLIRYQSLPGSGLCWPLSVPCLLTAFAQDSHAGLLRIPTAHCISCLL